MIRKNELPTTVVVKLLAVVAIATIGGLSATGAVTADVTTSNADLDINVTADMGQDMIIVDLNETGDTNLSLYGWENKTAGNSTHIENASWSNITGDENADVETYTYPNQSDNYQQYRVLINNDTNGMASEYVLYNHTFSIPVMNSTDEVHFSGQPQDYRIEFDIVNATDGNGTELGHIFYPFGTDSDWIYAHNLTTEEINLTTYSPVEDPSAPPYELVDTSGGGGVLPSSSTDVTMGHIYGLGGILVVMLIGLGAVKVSSASLK